MRSRTIHPRYRMAKRADLSAELGWYREVLLRPYAWGRSFFIGGDVMAYRFVDMASDPRSGQFAYFRSMADT